MLLLGRQTCLLRRSQWSQKGDGDSSGDPAPPGHRIVSPTNPTAVCTQKSFLPHLQFLSKHEREFLSLVAKHVQRHPGVSCSITPPCTPSHHTFACGVAAGISQWHTSLWDTFPQATSPMHPSGDNLQPRQWPIPCRGTAQWGRAWVYYHQKPLVPASRAAKITLRLSPSDRWTQRHCKPEERMESSKLWGISTSKWGFGAELLS